jgi:hypothetical protein
LGTKFTPGANFTPWGKISPLGVKLKTGLYIYVAHCWRLMAGKIMYVEEVTKQKKAFM